MKKIFLVLALIIMANQIHLSAQTQYSFPDESEEHEGTWLQWPHQYEYGIAFRNENDATWVAMTRALQVNEKVHIIAYNNTEKTRITNLLSANGGSLSNVDFKIFKTNDVWVRDNGPIYARDESGNLVIQDYGFNGWGGDYSYSLDNPIPISIGSATGMQVINLNSVLTVEGGAYELDGNGTLLATKTSILSQSNPSGIKSIRNPGKTQADVEATMTQYLGAQKFIWLDGWFDSEDITDAHVDGFAKFASGNKLVTMSQSDLLYWGVPQSDINKLYAASNVNNVTYTKVYLPLTKNDVKKTNGSNLWYKGSYCNYYVANKRVLVPNYNDPNDAIANNIIAGIYPGRTVVGIDVRNLYANGGMVHCVTQQQPKSLEIIVDTQAPSSPSNLSAYEMTAHSTNLLWSPSIDNVGVISYQIYKNRQLTGTTAYPSFSVTGLSANTTYTFYITAEDAAGNTSPPSQSINVTTFSAPKPTQYCTSSGRDASGEIISNVKFANIDNSSNITSGYEDFTNVSANVSKGQNYNITIQPKWFYGKYREGYAVYIDFNQDGDFTDWGEKVWSQSRTKSNSVSGSISIPESVFSGKTRMRVSMKYNDIPDPCEEFSYGQVEDYTINIADYASNFIDDAVGIRSTDGNANFPMELNIFPNPTESYIQIDHTSQNVSVNVYSTDGDLVQSETDLTKDSQMDVSNLSPGIYFIQCTDIKTGLPYKVVKFIKQ